MQTCFIYNKPYLLYNRFESGEEKMKNKNISFLIIFIGGLGLGLLLGNEFSDSYITIIGAILLIITLISMIFLSYNKKDKD